jgi:uncharacterized damage-inducible protein DinB
MTDPRFPIGRFDRSAPLTPEQIPALVEQIADVPAQVRAAVEGLDDRQLDTPYREGGWTARQLVHHLPDSHMNAYTRFRLALTEEEPTIKPYDEARWAELEDARTAPVEVSLTLLDALHDRWVRLLREMGPEDFQRTLRHPELGVMRLDSLLGLYAWHGRHHAAQLAALRERMGW